MSKKCCAAALAALVLTCVAAPAASAQTPCLGYSQNYVYWSTYYWPTTYFNNGDLIDDFLSCDYAGAPYEEGDAFYRVAREERGDVWWDTTYTTLGNHGGTYRLADGKWVASVAFFYPPEQDTPYAPGYFCAYTGIISGRGPDANAQPLTGYADSVYSRTDKFCSIYYT